MTPDENLFLAGDVRANENVALTSMHAVFVREHNRLVDIIDAQQPELSDEQQYQLARKIVGAEMQIITYEEFLPALLGEQQAPIASDYLYVQSLRPDNTSVAQVNGQQFRDEKCDEYPKYDHCRRLDGGQRWRGRMVCL